MREGSARPDQSTFDSQEVQAIALIKMNAVSLFLTVKIPLARLTKRL